MRRSAAPSQFNPSKRPKFAVPLLTRTPVTGKENEEAGEDALQNFDTAATFLSDRPERLSEAVGTLQQLDGVTASPSMPQAVKKTNFQPPGQKFVSPAVGRQAGPSCQGSSQSQSPAVTYRYFSVVWCKRSSKKHKRWEGDAVLVTHGRSVTLYDIEGKEIGKSSGFKSTELLALSEDETLPIGGKEILVMSILTEEAFKSGKCFTAAGSTETPATVSRVPVVNKPFMKPMRPVQSTQAQAAANTKATPAVVTARFDPSAPRSLVMPRPSPTHQWQWNKASLPVVDVVVDPYLSAHLRPHQREGVVFLYECVMGFRDFSGQGAILADDMGLGKTLQCISLIWTLHKQGAYGGKPVARKILIVTPGSLVKNWFQEFKKWLGSERLSVFAVASNNRVEEFMKTSIYPVLVISYEMLVRMYDLIKQTKFDLIVCDEGHRLKNTAIKTTSLIMSLPTQRRIVLTGTPIQNDLQEFYSIVEFCNPGVLGTSSAFRRVYEDPIVRARQPGATQEEINLGEERGSELSRMTQMFILRRTQEINNRYLPPKCDIVLFCRPSPLQLKLYEQLLRCQLIRSCLMGSLSGSPHLICIAALKQLCNHPSLVYQKSLDCGQSDESSVYQGLLPLYPSNYHSSDSLTEHSGKLAVLASLLQQLHMTDSYEKIVVVSNHTKTLDMIQTYCSQCGYQFLRLDGQTVTSKRQELVQRFNSKHGQEFIFLLSSKAGGVGLNLIGASRLVLYDIDWNPANDLQAMARVWRDGQRKKVHIYRLLTTGTIEEKIYQRQISKQGLSGAIMDVREKNDIQFSKEDLRDLFSINMTSDCDTHDLLNCDCDGKTKVREPVQDTVVRACQLGGAKVTAKKNLGMDELMDWKHHPSDTVHQFQEWNLSKAAEKISYVFYSEVQSQM